MNDPIPVDPIAIHSIVILALTIAFKIIYDFFHIDIDLADPNSTIIVIICAVTALASHCAVCGIIWSFTGRKTGYIDVGRFNMEHTGHTPVGLLVSAASSLVSITLLTVLARISALARTTSRSTSDCIVATSSAITHIWQRVGTATATRASRAWTWSSSNVTDAMLFMLRIFWRFGSQLGLLIQSLVAYTRATCVYIAAIIRRITQLGPLLRILGDISDMKGTMQDVSIRVDKLSIAQARFSDILAGYVSLDNQRFDFIASALSTITPYSRRGSWATPSTASRDFDDAASQYKTYVVSDADRAHDPSDTVSLTLSSPFDLSSGTTPLLPKARYSASDLDDFASHLVVPPSSPSDHNLGSPLEPLIARPATLDALVSPSHSLRSPTPMDIDMPSPFTAATQVATASMSLDRSKSPSHQSSSTEDRLTSPMVTDTSSVMIFAMDDVFTTNDVEAGLTTTRPRAHSPDLTTSNGISSSTKSRHSTSCACCFNGKQSSSPSSKVQKSYATPTASSARKQRGRFVAEPDRRTLASRSISRSLSRKRRSVNLSYALDQLDEDMLFTGQAGVENNFADTSSEHGSDTGPCDDEHDSYPSSNTDDIHSDRETIHEEQVDHNGTPNLNEDDASKIEHSASDSESHSDPESLSPAIIPESAHHIGREMRTFIFSDRYYDNEHSDDDHRADTDDESVSSSDKEVDDDNDTESIDKHQHQVQCVPPFAPSPPDAGVYRAPVTSAWNRRRGERWAERINL